MGFICSKTLLAYDIFNDIGTESEIRTEVEWSAQNDFEKFKK